MKKLQELKKIVYAELMENEEAIRSDTALIMGVCRRLGINTDESYAELALSGKLRQIENGSITRCRRKILEENPELAQTNSGKSVCKFSIAVNRNYTQADDEKVTDYFTIVTWNGQAENCARYLKKGKKIAVIGELQQRSFEGNDGVKRTVIEIQAQEVEFLSPMERQESR